ncbi:PLDc_N domain-containing protein [Amycolatopsis acidiphila]|uniref:PLDc_N domain-containing protein n=2 Tax=Amycolatopsis acidiphila TaxID=715473 RepID=A0A558ADM3_9PSEU|nr:PLDc_N domain-containing protein [Amycolatopsis acidiphila]
MPQIVVAILLVAVVAAFVLLVVGAVVSVLRSRLTPGMKLVWVVFVFIAPFIGSLLWFLIGRKQTVAAQRDT